MFALLLGTAGQALAKDGVTLVAYFPVPQGEHQLLSSRSDTCLAIEGGKVGVGTERPTSKLTVQGNVRIKGPALIGGDLAVGKSLTADGIVRAAGGLKIQNAGIDDVATVGSVWFYSKSGQDKTR